MIKGKLLNYNKSVNSMIIFLIILFGVLIAVFSGNINYNFWNNCYNIMTNEFFICSILVSVGLNSIFVLTQNSKSYLLIVRYKDYKSLINNSILDVVFYNSFLFLVVLILVLAGAILLSFGSYSTFIISTYNINIVFYLLFYIIRLFIYINILNVIVFLLVLLFNNILGYILIVINSLLMIVLPNISNISNFYEMPILVHYYLKHIIFDSFLLEITCSVLEVCLLLIIYKIIKYIVLKKKRDII